MRRLREANNPNYDARTGLGYGTDGRRFSPRMSQSTYPYKEPVHDFDDCGCEDDEEEENPQIQAQIAQKAGQGHMPWDSYRLGGADRFYYAGAATNIGKMQEQTTGRSISPIPGLYSRKEAVLGQGADGPIIRPAPARISLAGSKAGYSSALPLRDAGTAAHAYRLEDMPSGDERAISKLRRLIRAIHYQQEMEKEQEAQ